MKTCIGCKYAQWKKTKSGRMHPTGDGICLYKYKVPKLPNSRYWVGFGNGNSPSPGGGFINRKEKFETDCVYYQPE